MAAVSIEAVQQALAGVQDPEIRRPITELGMVKSVNVADDGQVDVAVYLTVAACPMRETITERWRRPCRRCQVSPASTWNST